MEKGTSKGNGQETNSKQVSVTEVKPGKDK